MATQVSSHSYPVWIIKRPFEDNSATLRDSISSFQVKSQAAYPSSGGASYNGHGSSNGYAQPSYGGQTSANYSLSAEEYRQKHDLTVQGDGAPDPIQDFESAGFTSDILDEVALKLQQFPSLLVAAVSGSWSSLRPPWL